MNQHRGLTQTGLAERTETLVISRAIGAHSALLTAFLPHCGVLALVQVETHSALTFDIVRCRS